MTNMKGKAQSPGTRTVKKLSVHGTKKREGSLLKKAINNSAAQPRETKDTRALQERREANRLSAEKSRQRKKVSAHPLGLCSIFLKEHFLDFVSNTYFLRFLQFHV